MNKRRNGKAKPEGNGRKPGLSVDEAYEAKADALNKLVEAVKPKLWRDLANEYGLDVLHANQEWELDEAIEDAAFALCDAVCVECDALEAEERAAAAKKPAAKKAAPLAPGGLAAAVNLQQ